MLENTKYVKIFGKFKTTFFANGQNLFDLFIMTAFKQLNGMK